MQLAGELQELLVLTTEATTRDAYVHARDAWIERVGGFDAVYCGAAVPTQSCYPTTTGVARNGVASCEASSNRYWPDRMRMTRAARRHGGVAVDVALFKRSTLDEMPLYDEVIAPLKFRSIVVAEPWFRGRPAASLYLGRALGRAYGRELDLLRHAMPILALGVALHGAGEPEPQEPIADPLLGQLTARERQIADFVCLGLTNADIARALDVSPNTVKNHVAAILSKAQVANRTELATAVAGVARPSVVNTPAQAARVATVSHPS